MKAVRKSLLTKKSQGLDGFYAELCQIHKELKLMVLKLFHKLGREGKRPNSIYKSRIILILKLEKEATTKRENCRSNSLMITDAKIFNEILTNQIQQHMKKIIHRDQVGFTLGMQGYFSICKLINVILSITESKTKTTLSSQLMKKKPSTKFHIMIKVLKKLERER
jgi:hypothetical protein